MRPQSRSSSVSCPPAVTPIPLLSLFTDVPALAAHPSTVRLVGERDRRQMFAILISCPRRTGEPACKVHASHQPDYLLLALRLGCEMLT